MEYSFTRYLAAKQSVDDRSLNHAVRTALLDALPPGPLDILEIGAGTGTMIDRLAGWGLPGGSKPDRLPQPVRFRYTAVDADPVNIAEGRRRLEGASLPVTIEWEAADVHDFARRERGRRVWDLLIAHAFLDLMDVPRLLPELFALLRPGGLFYFTINFDGLTILEPPVDPGFDESVVGLYHRTMDERRINGRPTGGSSAGRALLSQIPRAGGEVLAAGSSDWIVMPRAGGYPGDEAYFLRHILHFLESALNGRPELDPAQFAAWLSRRRAQIAAAELIFIAHQIDICGQVAGSR